MASNPNKLSQFWQELKRRKVVRVITVYAAAAFVILELVDIIVDPLKLPEWFIQAVIVFLCIGFIIAIILSWIYDIHPEGGIVKTEPANKVEEKEIPKSSNSWKIASYISFVMIVGLIILNILPRNDGSEEIATTEKSIAILPFKNISPDSANQYLLDGIMEAVLNYLTKVENVRVIASTSVEQYRGTLKSISEIGQELNVSYILEGSGQKYDDNFRLNTRLSDTKNSTLIWSNPYDREVKDILEFQIEIAQKIVSELRTKLSTKDLEILNTKPTFSEKAYTKYLRANEIFRSNPEKAVELLEGAIVIDPKFIDAYVSLSGTHMSRSNAVNGELSSEEAYKLAMPPIETALEIDPNHAGAHAQLGMIKYWLKWDFKGAEQEFLKAVEISGNPRYYTISLWVQNKRFDEALELALQKRDYDPVNGYSGIMLSNMFLGNYEKALNAYDKWVELDPRTTGRWSARIYMMMQEYETAIQHFEYAIEDRRIPFFMSDLAICYDITGDSEKANEILIELIDRYAEGEQGGIAFMVGKIYSGLGKIEFALEWLEKSYLDHELEMIWLYADPQFEILQDNEQYVDLLKRVGFDV